MFAFSPLKRLFAAFVLASASAAAGQAPTQDYEPRPAMWLLQDADTKIYLFGTIHILPKGFRWISPAVERTIGEADELVVETSTLDSANAHSATATMFLDRPVPILSRVPAESRKALKAAIRRSGMPRRHLDRLQSWAAAMAIGVGTMLEAYGATDPGEMPGVEDVLEERFREARKPILSVEKPLDVVLSLNAMPAEEQSELLVFGLDELGGEKEDMDEDDRAWATGKAEALALDEEKDFPAALYEVLLVRRNVAWAEWLERRLERPGTALFAVGAGHLAGRDSVQKMLEKRGLKVSRAD
ncbi:MAG TPA: TraB/GumN family protein [Allosphingosinicella sp.]|jgi:hypothetical protein